jgi:hypothetical protein
LNLETAVEVHANALAECGVDWLRRSTHSREKSMTTRHLAAIWVNLDLGQCVITHELGTYRNPLYGGVYEDSPSSRRFESVPPRRR